VIVELSAEVRYFWSTEPVEVVAWFKSGVVAPGGVGRRSDACLRAADDGLGIEKRGTRQGVEIKGRVEVRRELTSPNVPGNIEIWNAWTTGVVALDAFSVVSTVEQRLVRMVEVARNTVDEVPLDGREQLADRRWAPDVGCTIDLTRVTVEAGAPSWTLGFEAFGPLSRVEHALRLTVAWADSCGIPMLRGGTVSSWPQWLQRRFASATAEDHSTKYACV